MPPDADFPETLDDRDRFAGSLASLGDLDGDGRLELAVGAPGDPDSGVPGVRSGSSS